MRGKELLQMWQQNLTFYWFYDQKADKVQKLHQVGTDQTFKTFYNLFNY